jgi:hypothetical protein
LNPKPETVPNATVRIPRKLINIDLNCPICMNVLEDTTTVVECMHRLFDPLHKNPRYLSLCSDCINHRLLDPKLPEHPEPPTLNPKP